MVNERDIIREYENIYTSTSPFRKEWEGEISIRYKIPKYLRVFTKEFLKKEKPRSILEVGSGDGQITAGAIKACGEDVSQYLASEISYAGALKIKEKGIRVFQTSAMHIAAYDKSFDACISFDVMHHVTDPALMAKELMRVAKRFVFLIEPNRFALGRRLLERSQKYKSVGEYSYYPWEYRDFFFRAGAKKVIIKPFLFIVPKTPNFLAPLAVLASEMMERMPLLKWQCSGVYITVYK